MKDVIVFDGECRLCNGAVDFVVKRDPKRRFQFASLQSDTARVLLREVGVPQVDIEGVDESSKTVQTETKGSQKGESSKAAQVEKQRQQTSETKSETIYLLESDRCYTKSTAALRIARQLRFPWPLLYVGIIIPPFIRDAVYDFIGRNRKKWFGEKNTCDARGEEVERGRFLD